MQLQLQSPLRSHRNPGQAIGLQGSDLEVVLGVESTTFEIIGRTSHAHFIVQQRSKTTSNLEQNAAGLRAENKAQIRGGMAFRIKTNDTKPLLIVTLKDHAGAKVDISGATARFHMKKYGASSLKVDALASVTNGSEGQVSYSWSASDTDTAGTYYGEIEITYSDSKVETFPNNGYFTIIINEDLD